MLYDFIGYKQALLQAAAPHQASGSSVWVTRPGWCVSSEQLWGHRRGWGRAYITWAVEDWGIRAWVHTTAWRQWDRQCFVWVGDGWVVAVEGVQQRTFQETQRHNLLIHGRLVRRACVSICLCSGGLIVLLDIASTPPLRPSPTSCLPWMWP